MAIHNSASRVQTFLIFSFFLLINIISSGGHFDWRDGVEAFVVTEGMVLKNSAKLHPDAPSMNQLYAESWLSKYDIFSQPFYPPRSLMLSAIAVPFYVASTILSISPIISVGLFVNSMIIALISLIIFLFSLEMYGSRTVSFVLCLIFSVASFIWPYNTSFYPQPLQALLIIAAAYFIYKSLHLHPPFICNYSRPRYMSDNMHNGEREALIYLTIGGVLLGFSVFAHPSSVIVIPGFIGYIVLSAIRQSRKGLVCFLIPLTSVLCFMALVNYLRFGTITEFGYYMHGTINVHAGWEGLLGLWVSPGFGAVFYFPMVILLPLALKSLIYDKEHRRLSFLIIYIVIVNWLFVGTLSYDEPVSWSGAFAWGPRYMIPLLPFIVLSFGGMLAHMRKGDLYLLKLSAIVLLCASGFAINLVGKLVWVSYVASYMWEKLLIQTLAPNYWNIVAWNPQYSPILLHLKVLMDSNFVSQIQPKHYQGTDSHFVTYGLAPCQYDIYIYCKYGIVPIIVLAGAAFLLATLLLKVNRKVVYIYS
jgi:hypothetical protein